MTVKKTTAAKTTEEKADGIAEEAAVQAKTPADMDWNELIAAYPILDGLPVLAKPSEFTPGQSADLTVALSRVRETFRQVAKAMSENEEEADYAAAVGTAEIITTGDKWAHGLAQDEDSYVAWSKGHAPQDLSNGFMGLMAWYEGQLGK
jgi:hypothetical protein